MAHLTDTTGRQLSVGMLCDSRLLTKYNVPGPRYTSYPTVPLWDTSAFSTGQWLASVTRRFEESNERDGISVYVHLPYCERLCTFCGCIRHITKRHDVERPYIVNLISEWGLYLRRLPARPRIRELHLGGGTPTFFSPESLSTLVGALLEQAESTDDCEFGFEAHPNSTSFEHMRRLRGHGFTRLSLGVQDFDPLVQRTINRTQSAEQVQSVTEGARELGYRSVNFDLVYGLPRQSLQSVEMTVAKVCELRPDRISYYSYAHVPWIKGTGQRGFDENDLPRGPEKRRLYERARTLLAQAGYREIGMDHFALESDALYAAAENGTLHRNFMGYTPVHTRLAIGLGMSAIGDSGWAFAQNEKTVATYAKRLSGGGLPVFRGHVLSDEDRLLRRHILNIMCRFETSWSNEERFTPCIEEGLDALRELEHDGLVRISGDRLVVEEAGRPFLRNICMAFDARLRRKQPETRIFSDVI